EPGQGGQIVSVNDDVVYSDGHADSMRGTLTACTHLPRQVQLRVSRGGRVLCLMCRNVYTSGKELDMRVFVAGGTGAIGRDLVPPLLAGGHQVTASTRSAGKSANLAAAGAAPVVMDGLDRDAVLAAVQKAAPQVIVHQMTSLGITKDFRNFDQEVAVTK